MFSGDWYCLYTKPRQEKMAARSVEDAGMLTYLPLVERRSQRRGKAVWTQNPLFPSYIFAQATSDQVGKLRYLRGVIRIVGFGKEGRSFMVPVEALEAIDGHLTEGIFRFEKDDLKSGDAVNVLDGPLRGFEAVFKNNLKDKDRAVILLQILSAETEVIIDRELLLKKDVN